MNDDGTSDLKTWTSPAGAMPTAGGPVVRRAGIGDVDAMVALRVEMFRAMHAHAVDAARWQSASHEWFTAHIVDDEVFMPVVEVGGQVVATALGAVRDAVPSPSCPEGRDVLISNVCTLPSARRQGHGRRAFDAVMEWARATGISRVELLATGDGRSMYESAGFTVTAYPAMRATI